MVRCMTSSLCVACRFRITTLITEHFCVASSSSSSMLLLLLLLLLLFYSFFNLSFYTHFIFAMKIQQMYQNVSPYRHASKKKLYFHFTTSDDHSTTTVVLTSISYFATLPAHLVCLLVVVLWLNRIFQIHTTPKWMLTRKKKFLSMYFIILFCV